MLFFLVLAAVGSIAAEECDVHVVAVDEQGVALPGVEVRLIHGDAERVSSGFTDESGLFVHGGLLGNESVRVEGVFFNYIIHPVATQCDPPATTVRLTVIEPVFVSIVQVLAAPKAFHGRYITVVGALRLEFEGDVLYLDKASRKGRISKNGIRVDAPKEMWADKRRLQRGYSTITGRFNAERHDVLYSGALEDLRAWRPGS